MIDLSNKIFRTKNDAESERLLHIAVAQGYKLPAGLKSLVKHDCFKFTGFPYKTVSFPKYADENESDYSGSAFAKTHDGGNVKTQIQLTKPRKVTLEEIEQRFGCPIEIVS